MQTASLAPSSSLTMRREDPLRRPSFRWHATLHHYGGFISELHYLATIIFHHFINVPLWLRLILFANLLTVHYYCVCRSVWRISRRLSDRQMLGGAYLPTTSQRTHRMAPVGKLVPLVVPLQCQFRPCER